MSDYRQKLVNTIERSLTTVLEPEDRRRAVNKIIMILNDYEVTERCTDVVVYDDSNDRLLKQYLACLAVEGKSEKTIFMYKNVLEGFFRFVGKPAMEIGRYDVRRFLAVLKEKGLKDVSIGNNRAYVSAFFRWAVSEEILGRNPCDAIKPIKYSDPDKTPFSSVELDALRSACKTPKERAIIELLVTSGVRVAEFCALNIEDIDFQAMTVHVRNGKGGKSRVTYIDDVARKYLQKYLMSREETDSILIHSNRGRYTSCGVWKLLKRIGEAAGVEHVYPHRFRHTLASNLSSSGMAVQEIQRILGHSSLNTTMKYIHIDDRKVRASYAQHIA